MLNKYQKFLADAKKDLTFRTEEGEIRSLAHLRNVLLEKGEPFYNQYVSGENHFANWIENIFEDHELALSLKNAKSFKKAIKLIDDRVRYLRLWLSYNKKMDFAVNKFDVSFTPEYHVYENLAEFNQKNMPIPKLNPPKPPVYQKPHSKDEAQLRKLMENVPGFKPRKKNVLTNFFNKFKL